MALILCLETATTLCSVGLSKDGKIIALREDGSAGFSHAEKLHVFIEEVMAEAKLDLNDLDAIAVSKGPGSYTGLRIGVSAAKGLCFALNKPLLAIETLEVLAHQVNDSEIVVPMLDARRMEVYSAIYDVEFNQIRETKAEILSENSFEKYHDSEVTFIGNGVEKFIPLCSLPKSRFISEALPSAREMALLAERLFEQGHFENVAYFEPYYLKDFKVG
ncbi:MAG: tRNA (adenosine(37)-N6)-threonylcarbamoyltransferase complex dimerization subunit type 1 TsaB [Flavobacteriaceae bacterium]|nr:tRNA (adenosine(37)-N6)-threonylcarbamoyltransferase complex dimerization subunit type 1 TsaB [Flavobacteriaceae bacterium]